MPGTGKKSTPKTGCWDNPFDRPRDGPINQFGPNKGNALIIFR